jgi:hypothetical protein
MNAGRYLSGFFNSSGNLAIFAAIRLASRLGRAHPSRGRTLLRSSKACLMGTGTIVPVVNPSISRRDLCATSTEPRSTSNPPMVTSISLTIGTIVPVGI